jgi:hypothetical protein
MDSTIISFLDSAEIMIWQPRFSSVLMSNTRGVVAGPVFFDNNNKSWERRWNKKERSKNNNNNKIQDIIPASFVTMRVYG